MSTEENEVLDGLPEAEFAGLLDSIGRMAPLLGKLSGTDTLSPAARGREGLLLALKPYLSPARCDMVDSLLRILELLEMIRRRR